MSSPTEAASGAKASVTVPDEGVVRYPVAEIFHTLQGEGTNTGIAAAFVRLGGCDVGCPWCDTPQAQSARGCRRMSGAEIAAEVAALGAVTAVITGGEPLMHNLREVTLALHGKGVRTLLETSGTHPLSGDFDWVCLSPKPFAEPVDEIFGQADELKVVIASQEDFAFAERCAAKTGVKCRRLLQPEWSGREALLPMIVEYVKLHPEWRLSLQMHKLIDIP